MNRTPIDWVKNPDGTQGYTWNPITGCNNQIDGMCLGGMFPCYAYGLANGRLKQRYLANERIAYDSSQIKTMRDERRFFSNPFQPRFWEDRLWDLPIEKHAKPRGIFVCDMSDLFGVGIPEEWTKKVFARMWWGEQHRYYLLTKQPQNLIKFSPFPGNCWVGVTATNSQMFYEAQEYLEKIIATVRYISLEPFLERIWTPQINAGVVGWVIIGAQTKPYKPPKIEWVEEIVRACDKAGIPVFLKDNLIPLLKDLPEFCIRWSGWGEGTHRELRQEMPEGG